MIPQVGTYLVNFWKGGKVAFSTKSTGPTRYLAWLNLIHREPRYIGIRLEVDRVTITRMRKVPISIGIPVNPAD